MRRGLATLVALGLAAGVPACGSGDEPAGAAGGAGDVTRRTSAPPPPLRDAGTAVTPAARLETRGDPIRLRFKRPPRSGLLFDLDTGRVLWRRRADRVLPIASLTKMMTALVAVERIPAGGAVKVTPEALRYRGSGVGLLPRGRWVRIDVMLHGLLLVSGNDAAIAIAQRAAGSVPAFVAQMNARARSMGLTCTRFSSPDGLADRGNHSCTADLAALARAVLREPRLARIVRRSRAVLRYPGKGRRLHLNNTNPLLRMGYPGATGVKTGFTDAAGRCLVASARRRGVRLGVVLLDSPDPGTQARQLLDRGFRVAP